MNRYEIALKIQDAANPLAVVNELQKAMKTVFLDENKPIREDPAVWLIVDKLASMFNNSRLDVERYGQCTEACRSQIEKKETEYVEDTESIAADNSDTSPRSLDEHHRKLAVGTN
jgi:hypothetical protein